MWFSFQKINLTWIPSKTLKIVIIKIKKNIRGFSIHDYFEIQAKIGITKHMGGLKATRELLEMCRVDDSDHMLVVGSVTESLLSRLSNDWLQCGGYWYIWRYGEKIWEKLESGVEFILGDAENINFQHDAFDVVISESVTAFTNKSRSITEYHRVLKDGGYLGLNEVTWMINPPIEVKNYYQRLMGLKAETREGWLSYRWSWF